MKTWKRVTVWGGETARSYGFGFQARIETDYGVELWATIHFILWFVSLRAAIVEGEDTDPDWT